MEVVDDGFTPILPSVSAGMSSSADEVTLAQLLEATVRASSTSAILPSLSTPSSKSYISTLLSKDLASLVKEPDRLKKQSEVLDADLANLCYKSTADLLGVGDCVDTVEDGFS
jgi:hypothetical protein